MKKWLKYLLLPIFGVVTILFCPAFSSAQKDSIISYTEVVKVDSATKDELYIRARDWYNGAFHSSKDVLQIQDKEVGEIGGKGIFTTYYHHSTLGVENGYNQEFNFKITIWVKDNRYKYEITDIDNYRSATYTNSQIEPFGVMRSINYSPIKIYMLSKKRTDALFLDTKERAIAKVLQIIKSLQDFMKKKSTSDF